MKPAPSWVPESLEVKELQTELLQIRTSIVCALNQLLDLKDLNTTGHSPRLAGWAVRVGRDLGLDDNYLRDLEVAAIVHDIGTIGTPDTILNKPSALTDRERAIIHKHPEFGWAVLKSVPGLERVSLFVLHHHEAYDGSGYPSRLRGDDIPLGARIVSVTDAFDAMISPRPYRKALPIAEAIQHLYVRSGTQFDPDVTRHFIAIAMDDARSNS